MSAERFRSQLLALTEDELNELANTAIQKYHHELDEQTSSKHIEKARRNHAFHAVAPMHELEKARSFSRSIKQEYVSMILAYAFTPFDMEVPLLLHLAQKFFHTSVCARSLHTELEAYKRLPPESPQNSAVRAFLLPFLLGRRRRHEFVSLNGAWAKQLVAEALNGPVSAACPSAPSATDGLSQAEVLIETESKAQVEEEEQEESKESSSDWNSPDRKPQIAADPIHLGSPSIATPALRAQLFQRNIQWDNLPVGRLSVQYLGSATREPRRALHGLAHDLSQIQLLEFHDCFSHQLAGGSSAETMTREATLQQLRIFFEQLDVDYFLLIFGGHAAVRDKQLSLMLNDDEFLNVPEIIQQWSRATERSLPKPAGAAPRRLFLLLDCCSAGTCVLPPLHRVLAGRQDVLIQAAVRHGQPTGDYIFVPTWVELNLELAVASLENRGAKVHQLDRAKQLLQQCASELKRRRTADMLTPPSSTERADLFPNPRRQLSEILETEGNDESDASRRNPDSERQVGASQAASIAGPSVSKSDSLLGFHALERPPLFSSATVKREKGWEPDDAVECCEGCAKKFTMIHRRHHCRRCGHIFCWRCCPKLAVMSKGEDNISQTRICGQCATALSALQQQPPFEAASLQVRSYEPQLLVTWHQESSSSSSSCHGVCLNYSVSTQSTEPNSDIRQLRFLPSSKFAEWWDNLISVRDRPAQQNLCHSPADANPVRIPRVSRLELVDHVPATSWQINSQFFWKDMFAKEGSENQIQFCGFQTGILQQVKSGNAAMLYVRVKWPRWKASFNQDDFHLHIHFNYKTTRYAVIAGALSSLKLLSLYQQANKYEENDAEKWAHTNNYDAEGNRVPLEQKCIAWVNTQLRSHAGKPWCTAKSWTDPKLWNINSHVTSPAYKVQRSH